MHWSSFIWSEHELCYFMSEFSESLRLSLWHHSAYISNIIQSALCNFTLSNMDPMQHPRVQFTGVHSVAMLPFSNLTSPSKQKVIFFLFLFRGSVCESLVFPFISLLLSFIPWRKYTTCSSVYKNVMTVNIMGLVPSWGLICQCAKTSLHFC